MVRLKKCRLSSEGIEGKVYDHCGSAPAFIVVDTDGKVVQM